MTPPDKSKDVVRLHPPLQRGPLWYDDEIPERFFKGRATPRWVRETFPKDVGIKVGRRWAWYEADILAHLDACRGRRRSA